MALTGTLLGSAFDDASGTTLSVSGLDTTGYTNLVVFGKHEGTTTTLSVSDNKGSGAYDATPMVDHANGDLGARLFEQKIGSPGTGTTVTMTCAVAKPFRRMWVYGVNCSSGGIVLDANAQASGAGTAVDAGTLVTSAATFSVMGTTPYTFCTYTGGTGWTENLDDTIHGQSRSDATPGTYDPVCTISLSTDWVACAASFKEAAGGGAGSPPSAVVTGKQLRGFIYS